MISYALAAALLYVLPLSLADMTSKKSIISIGALRTGVLMMLIGMLPAVIYAYVLGFGSFSAGSIFLAVLTGIMFSIGYALFYKSIETEQISNSMAFPVLASAIFVIFGFLVFGESITTTGLFGVAIIFIGASMVSITEERGFNKRLVPAMIAFIIWSFGFIMLNYSIDASGSIGGPLVISRASTLVAFAAVSAIMGFKEAREPKKSGFRVVAAIGLLDATGIAGFGIVSTLHSIGIAGIMNAFVPIIGAIVGYMFFKERLSYLQLLGFVIMITGGIIISIF